MKRIRGELAGVGVISKSLTIWSILALVCLLGGGGATFFISQQILPSWAATGEGGGVLRAFTVNLPKGEHYIYYESMDSVPFPDQLKITIVSSVGEDIKLTAIPDSELADHTYAIGDLQGRALDEAGERLRDDRRRMRRSAADPERERDPEGEDGGVVERL